MSSFLSARKIENGKRKTFCIFLLAAILAAACAPQPQGPPQKARVERVLDGDTLILAGGARVRLLGIDAPEMEKDGRPAEFMAHQSKAALTGLAQGKEIRLEYDQVRYDHYGRLLAYLFLNNTFINAEMLSRGLAHVYIHPPNVRYREILLAAQSEAMDIRRGLWRKALNQDETYYLANRNTLRFHRPGCPLAGKIAPANRVKIDSLKQAYLEGFSPCRSCKP